MNKQRKSFRKAGVDPARAPHDVLRTMHSLVKEQKSPLLRVHDVQAHPALAKYPRETVRRAIRELHGSGDAQLGMAQASTAMGDEDRAAAFKLPIDSAGERVGHYPYVSPISKKPGMAKSTKHGPEAWAERSRAPKGWGSSGEVTNLHPAHSDASAYGKPHSDIPKGTVLARPGSGVSLKTPKGTIHYEAPKGVKKAVGSRGGAIDHYARSGRPVYVSQETGGHGHEASARRAAHHMHEALRRWARGEEERSKKHADRAARHIDKYKGKHESDATRQVDRYDQKLRAQFERVGGKSARKALAIGYQSPVTSGGGVLVPQSLEGSPRRRRAAKSANSKESYQMSKYRDVFKDFAKSLADVPPAEEKILINCPHCEHPIKKSEVLAKGKKKGTRVTEPEGAGPENLGGAFGEKVKADRPNSGVGEESPTPNVRVATTKSEQVLPIRKAERLARIGDTRFIVELDGDEDADLADRIGKGELGFAPIGSLAPIGSKPLH